MPRRNIKNEAYGEAAETKQHLRRHMTDRGFQCREDRFGLYCQKTVGTDVSGNTWIQDVEIEVDAETALG